MPAPDFSDHDWLNPVLLKLDEKYRQLCFHYFFCKHEDKLVTCYTNQTLWSKTRDIATGVFIELIDLFANILGFSFKGPLDFASDSES